jgi:hypothetical protein
MDDRWLDEIRCSVPPSVRKAETFDPWAEKMIRQQMKKDERLLWAGRPHQGFIFDPALLLLIPVGAFLVYELWGTFHSAQEWESDSEFWIIPVIISTIILFGIFHIFLFNLMYRSRMAYGLTDRQILIVSGKDGRKVVSFQLDTLDVVTHKPKWNGRGTILFGHRVLNMNDAQVYRGNVPCFYMLDHSRDVYDRICQAQEAVKGSTKTNRQKQLRRYPTRQYPTNPME